MDRHGLEYRVIKMVDKDNFWHILLSTVEDGKIVLSDDQPTKSGQYLCTCVIVWGDKLITRYLKVMEFDNENKYWHDCGRRHSISHNILAWTDKVSVSEFDDFNYLAGGYFLKKDGGDKKS